MNLDPLIKNNFNSIHKRTNFINYNLKKFGYKRLNFKIYIKIYQNALFI